MVKLLTEMFPNTCVMEINHCLSVASGNTEQAAQLILTRQECGQSLSQSRAKNVSQLAVMQAFSIKKTDTSNKQLL